MFSCHYAFSQDDLPQWISDYFDAQYAHEFDKANEIFEKNFDRSNSDCCFINGLRQIDSQNYDWAIGWLTNAIAQYTPKNYYWKSTIYYKLSEVYNILERYDEALDCLEKAKDFEYENGRGGSDVFIIIGKQYEIMEKYSEAENLYYHILSYDNNDEEAKIRLAHLYLNYAPQQDSVLLDSLALSLINEVIAIHPSNSLAYYARGQYYQKAKGNYKAAIDDYLSVSYYDTEYGIPDEFYYCAGEEFQYALTAINQWVKYCNTKQKREKDETCLEESFWFEQIREIIHFGVPVLCTIESVHRAREGIDRDDKELIRN